MESKKNGKVVSKYHRIRLTDDIRDLIQNLPVRRLEETQVGNHVYAARGEIRFGIRKRPVAIRISHKDGRLKLFIQSEDVLDLELPYDTPEQRCEAPAQANEMMRMLLC